MLFYVLSPSLKVRLSLVTLPLWQTHLWNLRWIFSPLYMNAQFTGYLYLFFLGKFNTSHSANHSKISHLIPFLLYPRQCYQQILLNHQNPWHLCQRQTYWISSPPPELSLISWPLHLRHSCHLFPWPLYIRKTGQWILCHEFIFTQRSHIIYSLFLSSQAELSFSCSMVESLDYLPTLLGRITIISLS